MNKLNELLKIADIHAARITRAIKKLSAVFPLSDTTVENLSEENFLFVELLTNRFAKLQDFMGTKLIDAFLEEKAEMTYNATMIDKVNKLERLGIIHNAQLWTKMREVRNHLAHEYPDHPEITAKYLNEVFLLASELILLLQNIKAAAK